MTAPSAETGEDGSQGDLHAKLKDVEEQLARLRGENRAVAEQLGDNADGVQDEGDTAAQSTNFEETEAIVAMLEQRRETLLRQLGED